MRVADYIMSVLQRVGVGHVFTVTGRGALFLTDALAKNEHLETSCVHHEQAAAFAAIAYAQQTGGLGACLVSTGCASTNAITGVLSAWQDQLPVIFVSGQHVLEETTRYTGIGLRTYGQQEADIVAMVEPITKFAHMVSCKDEVPEVIEKAIREATSGRKGPVWIDVPLDIQSAHIDDEPLQDFAVVPEGMPKASEAEMDDLVSGLREAQRPIVLIGSGVRSANAEEDLFTFIDKWNVPVAFAASAPDIYGSANDLSVGSVGAMGCSRSGSFAVQNADLLVVLGCRLTGLTTGSEFEKFARAAKVIVIDIDPEEHKKKGIRIDRFIHSDVKFVLEKVNDTESAPAKTDWIEKCHQWKRRFSAVEPVFHDDEAIDLYELADCLSEKLPRPSTLVTDSGLAEVILPTNVRFAPGMNSIHPASQGVMGFALPAAVGAYLGGKTTVVAVTGDGSIMMNLQELETIRFQKLPIKIIVINNNVYSIIRRRQKELFRRRTVGTDPENGVSCPDFSEVAHCFGLKYMRVDKPEDLAAAMQDLMLIETSVLCEINGRDDQGYIEVGHTRSVSGRGFVRRPIEDQAPFLDRDLFLSEMIVEPIDQ